MSSVWKIKLAKEPTLRSCPNVKVYRAPFTAGDIGVQNSSERISGPVRAPSVVRPTMKAGLLKDSERRIAQSVVLPRPFSPEYEREKLERSEKQRS
jgi:hypothetical protein